MVHVKDPVPLMTRRAAGYHISYSACPALYMGQTGRTVCDRITEHKYTLKTGNGTASALAKHTMKTGHSIDWDGMELVDNYLDTLS